MAFPGERTQADAALREYQRLYRGRLGIAQIHKSFANLKDAKLTGDGPPLSRLLRGRGGRGGERRLKTYLTLVWLAERHVAQGKTRWEVDAPREVVAQVMGVYDDDTLDSESDRRRDIRVRDRMDRSVTWLHDHELIHRHKYSSRITLLDDRGTGEPYFQPGSRELPKPFPKEYLWFKIPATFWTTGLIGKMAADELAAYLVLLSDLDSGSFEYRRAPDPKWQFLSSTEWANYIALAREMRYSGFSKLEERGLVDVRARQVNPHSNPEHTRNEYYLQPEYDGRIAPPTDADRELFGLDIDTESKTRGTAEVRAVEI